MTRKEAKRRAELYSALAEGKTIQVLFDCEWNDINIDAFKHIYSQYKYRIKPEPKYRPFKSQEECWNEMLYLINGMSNESIVIMEDINSFKEAMNIYEFKDGTPFGIKEE